MAGTALTIVEAARELGIDERDLLPDAGAKRFRFRIRSESRPTYYNIAWDVNDREWGCSCPGWVRARNGHLDRKCKHISALMPTLERVATPRKIGR
jgi:hypothetical protein